jgi:hypothetical protein
LRVQGAGLSGIVAIIFCGITINRAAKAHLNHSSLRNMESFFHVTANLAELFVFIYIGTMLFIDTQEWHIWGFLVGAGAAAINDTTGRTPAQQSLLPHPSAYRNVELVMCPVTLSGAACLCCLSWEWYRGSM